MSQKHLHELLKEDQEPFHLKNYIADRRSQLKPTTTVAGKSSLNIKKHKPIIKPNFCINHVCLFSLQDSPDYKKSPFLDFPASFPARELNNKSPCNNAAAAGMFHIPAKTAAMLVEAAGRVQKPKPESKQIGLGLFGSFLRRLKDRSTKVRNRGIGPVSENNVKGKFDQKRLSRSCNGSMVSSGEWWEKSSELETSCSSRSVHEFELEDVVECFCSNPSSPFRFSLQRSPSLTRPGPEFSSPVSSPSCHFKQDKESCEVECPQETNRQKNEEEKEQCSPVSVLDILFDDEEEEERDAGVTEEDYDIECCYQSVQSAKHQLLQKLQRFERLAGLDPIKLENHMLEQCCSEDEDVLVIGEEVTNEKLFREIVNHLGVGKIPWYMKKLVFDLIEEENKNEEHHVIVQRVCKRMHSWKVVELNTIDMMVETDFRNEGWKRRDEETIDDTVMDIEWAIFGFLVEELAQ
ncbi:hypothetical protein HanRHA438_Chr01g0042501 [Helianthus annuus]|uniref:DUF4378 domain-containing protein n=1 Tax=Helianthus annuus TaxID=4232 RepID=A0A251VRZ1_HELAN|nr:uncharacterized protein LOC110882781 [Helianthus annuus]KAF5823744.1 hypothetical protein HanXRQr2_Chr01g0041601 [Helianthus annuus]KAJ0949797.1 hypothetical protein HanRHA438_Chr01g0042501 [Helianthus annuus]KAJ0958578.1 hypothetical protein HanPSC8_Chr01g0040521 [Helianthus annuus]